MSGFSSNSTALSIFQVDKPGSVSADGLKKFAFRPIDKTDDTESVGWTNIDDLTDLTWRISPPEKGGFMCFSMRVDKRKVQSAVLKRLVRESMNAELEKCRAEGREFISRARKKELKELNMQKLLSQAMPVPAVTEAALDMSNGTLYVASTSSSAMSALLELLARSFGVNCTSFIDALGVSHEDVEKVLAKVYADGAAVEGFQLEQGGQVHLRQGSDAEVTVKNEPDSVQSGLAAGLSISKLKINMLGDDATEWTFVLNSDLTVSGLKTPHVDKPAEDDADAAILEKLFLVGQVKDVLAGLVKAV